MVVRAGCKLVQRNRSGVIGPSGFKSKVFYLQLVLAKVLPNLSLTQFHRRYCAVWIKKGCGDYLQINSGLEIGMRRRCSTGCDGKLARFPSTSKVFSIPMSGRKPLQRLSTRSMKPGKMTLM